MTLDSSSDPVDAGSTIETTTGPIRLITGAAIFDGHDAAISIFRRIFQSKGCEVIHLGHDRGADEVAHAAIQEDAHAIAITSYQGGAVEMFTHTRQILDAAGLHHVHLFGGGGGTILPAEIKHLRDEGIARIFSPDDGRTLGLEDGQVVDGGRRRGRSARRESIRGPLLGDTGRPSRHRQAAHTRRER